MKMLVLGSSVSLGCGASLRHGWTCLLAQTLSMKGWTMVNRARPGTTTSHWQQSMKRTSSKDFAMFDIVIVSLSLGNEGLARHEGQEEAEACAASFLERLQSI